MPQDSVPNSDDDQPDRTAERPEKSDDLRRTGQAEQPVTRPAPALPLRGIPSQPDARTPREAVPGPTRPARLLDLERSQRLRAEWHSIQAGFVDDPRQAVRQADGLVAKSAGLLGEAVAARREELSGAGRRPDDAARTEDLRLALRQYRTLLDRLLEL